MRKRILFFVIIVWVLSLCACSAPAREDTGGDTDIGGLIRDILHDVRGDGPGNTELEYNDAANPALPEEREKESGIK